jgi:predicted dehydrogenase
MTDPEERWYDSHIHLCDPDAWSAIDTYLQGFAGATAVSIPLPEIGTLNAGTLAVKRRAPDRLWALGAFDHRPGAAPLADQARQILDQGFDGFKIWCGKPWAQIQFGIAPDAPGFDSVYDIAAAADVPVLIHFADPPEFWAQAPQDWLSFDRYIAQAEAVAGEHRRTRFVFAHLLFLAGDLVGLTRFLEDHPNVDIDLAPGKYMYAPLTADPEAAGFFRRYADRILFGTDGFFFPDAVPTDYRRNPDENAEGARFPRAFLKTTDEMPDPFPPPRWSAGAGLGPRRRHPCEGRPLQPRAGLREGPATAPGARSSGGRPVKTVRAAVVGLGIGMAHVAGYRQSPHARLVTVCDLKPTRLDRVGGTFAEGSMKVLEHLFDPAELAQGWQDLGVTPTADLDQVLADPDIDLVSLCTPDHTHEELALRVIEAGKHLLLEKPVALSSKGAGRVAAAAGAADVYVGVEYEFRLNPAVLRLKALVDHGELGDVKAFSLYHFRDSFRRDKYEKWIQSKATSGGLLVEETSHWFDLARYVTGKEVEQVHCVGTDGIYPDFDFEDIAYVNGVYTGGGVFQISHALSGFDFSLQLQVHGTQSVAWCALKDAPYTSLEAAPSDGFGLVVHGPVGGKPTDARRETFGPSAREPENIRDFVAAAAEDIALGRPPACPVADGIAALDIALACRDSYDSGRVAKVTVTAPRA